MSHQRSRSSLCALVIVLAVSFSHARAVLAQSIPLRVEPANPSSLEVRWPAAADSDLFEVELFPASSPRGAAPVRQSGRRTGKAIDPATTRIDIGDLFDGLPDGEYVATLHVLDPSGARRRSTTSDRFAITGYRSPAVAAEGASERRWTRVAIAIAAGLLLIPFLIR